MNNCNSLHNTIVSIDCKLLDYKTEKWLLENKPYGIILFQNNIDNENQVKALTEQLKSLYSPSPFISIDFEGGKVNRLRKITGDLKSPIEYPNLKDFGKYSGELLKKLGIDINFAPVLDIDFGLKNNGLDNRYLGKNPDEIMKNATEYLEGLESEGVIGCLKHYPGLGKVVPDTHYSLFKLEKIDEYEESVFKELTKKNRLIMVAHVYFKELGEISTYSHSLLERIKRFHKGKIITDDLSMKALPEKDDFEKIAKASDAGFDLTLIRFNNPIFK